MTRLSYALFACVIISITLLTNTYAQSIIELKDGTIIEAYIESMEGATIDYRKNSESDQTLYFVNKNDIKSIQIKDASVDLNDKSYVNNFQSTLSEESFEYMYFANRFFIYDENGKKSKLSKREAVALLKDTPGEKHLKNHYRHKYISNSLLIPGAVFTGVGLAGALIYDSYYDPELFVGFTVLLGFGIALDIASIPFSIISFNSGVEAAHQYTKYRNKSVDRVSLNLGPTRNGFGFILKF